MKQFASILSGGKLFVGIVSSCVKKPVLRLPVHLLTQKEPFYVTYTDRE